MTGGSMVVETTPLDGPLILRPSVFRDPRGYFLETWSEARYAEAGLPAHFVQDNVSVSAKGVLRGLHAQAASHAQGKLVSALAGTVFDVAVDIRRGSPTYGRWHVVELRAAEGTQFWIPPGFLHGFQAVEDGSVVLYKCTAPYCQPAEFSVAWNDPLIGVPWPIYPPKLSAKDAAAMPLGRVDDVALLPFVVM